ncbi:uncharacterized protein BJ212DRAFT_346804 [Suillus subaureus]|uniref:Uncharacterized protein n=1 Tax=Suillus subaureus TaxID=48587 RepID=A0A9P7E9W7_9AGAM|nr:uncharacterized protein BJ212DRAFT_346804 [Suillus subaureus]KAG1814684.1 hypothetical protein BJ212DRAFT_346804 [Suillus subaureus]
MALLPFTLAAILLLLCTPFVCALPPPNCTSTSALDVTDSPSSSHTRTLWNIIWSCAATLFACTWSGIHPNIPGMDEGRIVIFFRRLYIMVLALIAPELMVTWAAIQFLSARGTAKAFNDAFNAQLHQTGSDHSNMGESTATLLSEFPTSNGKNSPHPSAPHFAGRNFREWTMTHGFFAWMGGFILYCDNKPRATLTPKELMEFVHKGYVDIPDITQAEIEGRSKADALSKGIAILQLAWFVLQFNARCIQNLPITLFEIDTLAVVSLTSIACLLWWNKPKDVRCPYAVHWTGNRANIPRPCTLTYEKANPEFSLDSWHHYLIILIYPLRSLMGTAVTISPRSVRERRIPYLGGYDNDDRHDRNHVITLFLGCFSAVITGVLHCLGWSYLFQGHTEQILWRVTSIVTASTSIPLLLIFGWVILFDVTQDSWVVRFSVVTVAFIYVTTRITVIVLISSSLRSLPPGIYDTVAWTTFVPHFR